MAQTKVSRVKPEVMYQLDDFFGLPHEDWENIPQPDCEICAVPRVWSEEERKIRSELAKRVNVMPDWTGRKHSEATKKKISENEKGNTKRRRAIEVNGVVYPTIRGAMKELGIGFIHLKKIGRMLDK